MTLRSLLGNRKHLWFIFSFDFWSHLQHIRTAKGTTKGQTVCCLWTFSTNQFSIYSVFACCINADGLLTVALAAFPKQNVSHVNKTAVFPLKYYTSELLIHSWIHAEIYFNSVRETCKTYSRRKVLVFRLNLKKQKTKEVTVQTMLYMLYIMLFCLFQPINDVTKSDCLFKRWNNEVRVCGSNPCGVFLMALNAPLSPVFLKSQASL